MFRSFLAKLFARKVKKMPGYPDVYVIGDSHTTPFKMIPNCIVHHVGSVTMHRAGRDQLKFVNFDDFALKDGDVLLFVFGQIDIGWHVCKERDAKGRNLEEIVTTLARNYLSAIQFKTGRYQNVVKIVYSVPPASNRSYHPVPNELPPYSGSIEDRVRATDLLNCLLKKFCESCGCCFLDVYKDYSDENGILNKKICDASLYHINPKHREAIRRKLFEILDLKKCQLR